MSLMNILYYKLKIKYQKLYKRYYMFLYSMYTYNNQCLIVINMQRSIFIEMLKDVHKTFILYNTSFN